MTWETWQFWPIVGFWNLFTCLVFYLYCRLWHWSSSSMPLRAVTSKMSTFFPRNWVKNAMDSCGTCQNSILFIHISWNIELYLDENDITIHYFVYQMSMLQTCTFRPLTHTWLNSPMIKPNTWVWTNTAPLNQVTTGDKCILKIFLNYYKEMWKI